jgi:hypothetical protein
VITVFIGLPLNTSGSNKIGFEFVVVNTCKNEFKPKAKTLPSSILSAETVFLLHVAYVLPLS